MSDNGFLSILLIALGLSADCFAVSVSGSVSLKKVSPSQVLRAGLIFGVFQALMPVLGWLAGRAVVDLIAGYGHWVAFGLLVFVGGRMIRESLRARHDGRERPDFTRGLLLLALAAATSIDALTVGLSFAFLKVNILAASLTIGVITFAVTALGFYVGRRAGGIIGRWAEIGGGIVIIGIGLKILLEQLFI